MAQGLAAVSRDVRHARQKAGSRDTTCGAPGDPFAGVLHTTTARVWVPTPEATSQGVPQLVGQRSVAPVYLMTLLKTSSGSFTPALLLIVGLLVAGAALVSRLREPAVGDGGGGP